MVQDYYTTYIKRDGVYFAVIMADTGAGKFHGKLHLQDQPEVLAESIKETVDKLLKQLERADFDKAKWTRRRRKDVQQDLEYLREEYGELTPEEYIKEKVEDRIN
jgi:1-aminocyclopropane-1-carboxylate deaminase/D-cysteine desulfhydrase-like pyridoxal-dependent ACC family enzyme